MNQLQHQHHVYWRLRSRLPSHPFHSGHPWISVHSLIQVKVLQLSGLVDSFGHGFSDFRSSIYWGDCEVCLQVSLLTLSISEIDWHLLFVCITLHYDAFHVVWKQPRKGSCVYVYNNYTTRTILGSLCWEDMSQTWNNYKNQRFLFLACRVWLWFFHW